MARRAEIAGAQGWIRAERCLVYGLRFPEGLVYLTSKREVISEADADKKWILTSRPSRRCRFSVTATAAYKAGSQVDPAALYREIESLFRTHVGWPSEHTPSVLALWVMGTYLFMLFRYYPYLAISSPTKRCGKSLVLEILHELCFHPAEIQHNPTPAGVVRDIHANHGTVLIDEVETLTDADKEVRSQMLAVLCGGFKRGSAVTRNEPLKNGKYVPVEFYIYSPKAMAGINDVADIIRDRSLRIYMKRATTDYPEFDTDALETKLTKLRDSLYVWGLSKAEEVAAIYAERATLPLPADMDHRARDIARPLAAIAKMVGAETSLLAALEEIRDARVEDEDTSEGEIETARAILLRMLDVREEPELILTTLDVMGLLQEGGLGGMNQERNAQAMMRKLGFTSRSHRKGESFVRGYRVMEHLLKKEAT